MNETGGVRPISWWKVWGGLAVFGVGNVFVLAAQGVDPNLRAPTWWAPLTLAAAVAGVAWLSYRGGARSFALGIVGGYVLMTVLSGGTCTLVPVRLDVGVDLVAVGFFGYLATLAVFGAVLVGMAGWRNVRRGR